MMNAAAKSSPLMGLLTGLAMVCAGGVASAQESGVQLPDIGDSSGAVVSQQDEKEYGQALMREFRRLAHVIDDPLTESYIKHLGYSLVAHSDQPERDFTFFVVDNQAVNAFAAPGGYIGIHTGLILTAESESEVAGVMAHEVAHVTQRHLSRAIESAQKVNLPLMLLMLGAAIAGAGDADVMSSALIGGKALMAQMQINFTRSNEHEADRIGIQTLARAGYDPNGMASFFGKMTRLAHNYGDGPPEFLRTHPIGTTRIAEAKNRAAQVEVSNAPDRDTETFFFIRERLRVLSAENPQDTLVYYRRMGESGQFGVAEQYGLALAHLATQDPVGAFETLENLARERPDSLPVQLSMAETELLSGKGGDAERRFETLNERFPGSLPVTIAFADTLLKVGGPQRVKKAEALLRPLLTRHPEDASVFLIYSRAANDSGDRVKAQSAHAQYVFLQGRVYDAVAQLRNLLDSTDLDYYQRARVEARIAELEPILARIQRENGWDPSEGKDRDGALPLRAMTLRNPSS
jgi:predicted Zn-dependent protease